MYLLTLNYSEWLSSLLFLSKKSIHKIFISYSTRKEHSMDSYGIGKKFEFPFWCLYFEREYLYHFIGNRWPNSVNAWQDHASNRTPRYQNLQECLFIFHPKKCENLQGMWKSTKSGNWQNASKTIYIIKKHFEKFWKILKNSHKISKCQNFKEFLHYS